MDTWGFLADLLTLLAVSLVLGALFERIRQSAIVGYLIAGCLLGPEALAVVDSVEDVRLLAELGVALLLFSIGLEVSWRRLRSCGRSGLIGGTLQVVLTASAGAAVGWLAGLEPRAALIGGIAMALSSTASVLRLLQGRTELDTRHGRHALAILLVQDIAVVPLVLLAAALQSGGSAGDMMLELGRALGVAGVMVVAFLVLFRYVVPRVLDFATSLRNRDLPILLALIMGLGSALLAHMCGVSPSIGAFVAGFILAGSPYAVLVRTDVSALRTAFMTLFFGSVGMLANLSWVGDHIGIVVGVVAMIIVLKAGLLAAILSLLRLPARDSLATGVALGQAGEFAFVIMGTAGALLSTDTFMLLTSVTVVTLVVTPGLVSLAGHIARTARVGRGLAPRIEEEGGHVVVVGFGPAGRALVETLGSSGHVIELIDMNRELTAEARKMGLVAVVGDAAHPDVLEHARVKQARLVAVTIPDDRAAEAVARQVRSQAPGIPVVVRGRYNRQVARLEEVGALVVDEERTVGEEMGRNAVSLLEDSA